MWIGEHWHWAYGLGTMQHLYIIQKHVLCVLQPPLLPRGVGPVDARMAALGLCAPDPVAMMCISTWRLHVEGP